MVRLGNLWEGVRVRDLLDRAEALPSAKYAIIHGYDSGWTTNLPLADLLADDVLLADTHEGEPLSADHGGPVRLVVPSLYAWKSAKWAREIELVAEDTPGYWEQGGYHMRGDRGAKSVMADVKSLSAHPVAIARQPPKPKCRVGVGGFADKLYRTAGSITQRRSLTPPP